MDVDAVVVGAGFAGLYQLLRLRRLGLVARVFEAGGGVGGTWYWNRYPGARCDISSLDYSYTFDDELRGDWQWSELYAAQPEILRYLEHVADRYDLRRDITFDTRVTSAEWDDGHWRVCTDTGEAVRARFLIMATGCLSVPKTIELPGQDRFQGRSLYTFRWPHEPVDVRGDRVGVIGTGSSAVQSVPLIAEQAAELTIFQRTPTYVQPAGNRPITSEDIARFNAGFADYRQRARASGFGVPLDTDPRPALDVDPAERAARYEAGWGNGLLGVASAYPDLLVSRPANETAADFVRSKITEVIRDPELAASLTPDYAYACKRPCLDNTDTGYYGLFNRAGTTLVDLRATPLVEITERGVRTTQDEYELDTLVYATGFDALTGAIAAVDITGRNGTDLRKHWSSGPRTYLGLAVTGFPNLFLITGPNSPSVLTNMVLSIEDHVDMITDLIANMCDKGRTVAEATPEAEESWMRHSDEVAAMTLFPETDSWYTGANVDGKARSVMIYVGGLGTYRQICADVVADDHRGFEFT